MQGVSWLTKVCQHIEEYVRKAIRPAFSCYDMFGSDIVLESTAAVSITFSDPPGGVDIDTTTLALYRFDGIEWSSASIINQVVSKDTTTYVISSSGSYTRSGQFGVFFLIPDSSAPLTSFLPTGTTFIFNNDLFISTDAFIVLSATDPVVNGFNSGVATTYYRLDPASAAANWSVYASSLAVPLGTHALEYYSRDWKGNDEVVKTSTFTITAGNAAKVAGDFHVVGKTLFGFLDSGAQFEVESRAENDYTLLVSSQDRSVVMTADNIGRVGIGGAGVDAVLNLHRSTNNGDIALELKSGNSTGSVSSVQVAFGAQGEAALRHTLWTQHNPGTAGNRMNWSLWHPGTGSTTTLADMTVMALEAVTAASGGSVHVRPSGTPDVELEVSNGLSTGGGVIHRLSAGTYSSRRLKSRIKPFSASERRRAAQDLLNLRPVEFRYKRRDGKGTLVEDPSAPLRKGYVYEDAPESVRGAHEDVMIDDRVLNLELALQEAAAELERLEERLRRLNAR